MARDQTARVGEQISDDYGASFGTIIYESCRTHISVIFVIWSRKKTVLVELFCTRIEYKSEIYSAYHSLGVVGAPH